MYMIWKGKELKTNEDIMRAIWDLGESTKEAREFMHLYRQWCDTSEIADNNVRFFLSYGDPEEAEDLLLIMGVKEC
jgi:hypothetical protein